MPYIQRPREQNIFDNYGLNMDYTGVNPSAFGSQGMSPSQDISPINYPFSQQSSTRDGYANMFGQNPPKSPFDVDFGQGKFDPVWASQAPTPPPTPQTSDPGDLESLINAINKVYTPDTTSRDRFNTLLDNMPERNKPSWGRKLVASGMGLGAKDPASALTTMEGAMYAPYIRDMAEFKEKAGPYQQAASLENTANINERTLAGNVVSAQRARADQQSRERIADQRNETNLIRNKAYALKANGYTIKFAGDRILALNPNPPFDSIDMGPSGGMDRAEQIILEGKQRIEASRVQGEAAAGRTTQAGAEIFVNEKGEQVVPPPNPRNPNQPSSGKIFRPPTLPGPEKKPSISDKIKIENDALKDMYETEPDAKEYIEIAPGMKYQMKKRPVPREAGSIPIFGRRAITQDQVNRWDELKKRADPSYVPPPSDKSGTGLGTKEAPKIYDKVISSRSVKEEDAEFGRALKKSGDSPTSRVGSITPQQAQQEVAAGRKLIVIGPNGEKGIIDNTPEQIREAQKRKFKVQIGQ
jgi:hypothetical protein